MFGVCISLNAACSNVAVSLGGLDASINNSGLLSITANTPALARATQALTVHNHFNFYCTEAKQTHAAEPNDIQVKYLIFNEIIVLLINRVSTALL